MKHTVLDRYERTADGSIVIDVAANQVEELYNNYDKCAPYVRRDLDQDLVDYLIDSAREVRSNPFVVRFTLASDLVETSLSRIRRSVNAYFVYLEEIERQGIRQMFRRSAVLFSIGIAILVLSVLANRQVNDTSTVLTSVVAEGLTVASWVALWEALAILLLEWLPHHRNLTLFRRLATARLLFRQSTAAPLQRGSTPAADSDSP